MCAFSYGGGKNPLPFRRLKRYVNGIWDEQRQEFYPFKIAYGTVGAKPGIRYYIHMISASGANTGDHAAVNLGFTCTVDGVTQYPMYATVPVTTAADGTGRGATNSCSDMGILCDSGTAITVSSGASTGALSVVYAEIPVDVS